jgi:hypothetical protein
VIKALPGLAFLNRKEVYFQEASKNDYPIILMISAIISMDEYFLKS